MNLTSRKNLTKYLFWLILMLPAAVILFSSVFAEKTMGQGLSACEQNLTCSASTFAATCSPTQTKCLSKTFFLSADQLQTGESVVCCNNPSVPIPTPACNYDSKPDGCGNTSQWCNNGTCTNCTSGFLNCDGTRGCEISGSSCPAPTSVQIPTCFDDCLAIPGKSETQCSKECGLSAPTPTPTPPPWTGKWKLYTSCPAPTSPPAASAANCGNETCSSNQTCIGNPASTPFCLQKGVAQNGAYCGTPSNSPNNDACSSGYCDPTLYCINQPAGPTQTPIPSPTATPIPVTITITRITPTSTPPPTPTPTPTPNLTTLCSSKNPDLATQVGFGYQYQCSQSCNGDWKATATQNFNCLQGSLCCYKAPFGFETTPPSGGPSPGVSSNDTFLAISLSLEGVGNTSGSNPNPKTLNRQATIDIFSSNQVQTTKPTALTYDSISGLFKGTANLGSFFAGGNYLAKIKSERYLKRLLPGIINITSGQTITLPTLTLLAGDMNGDNVLDALDYNIFVSCFGPKADTTSCTKKATADVNDDGVVDGVDYNLFVHSLAIRKGD